MNIQQSLTDVLNNIPDPRKGLSNEVLEFVFAVTPMINVDLLVQDARGTLLSWRDDVHGTGWHVPGGIIRAHETIEKRLSEVARIELGATVSAEGFPCDIAQLFGQRGHFISLLYECKLTSEIPQQMFATSSPIKNQLRWIKGVPTDLLPIHRRYQAWLRNN